MTGRSEADDRLPGGSFRFYQCAALHAIVPIVPTDDPYWPRHVSYCNGIRLTQAFR